MCSAEDHLNSLEEDNSETSTEIASTWNSSHETLLASIADRSNCSRWLHNKCQTHFETYNFYLTVPNIAISAVAGSATIGLSSIFPDNWQHGAATVIGIFTLGCGILTSLNQYMKSAQYSESHRSASVAYGKLHRIIASELALRRDQRLNASDFLKLVRLEQDRLQETSPPIIDRIVEEFRATFKNNVDLEKPEIVGDLDHVRVNRSTKDNPTPPVSSSSSATSSSAKVMQFPITIQNDHSSQSFSADQG